MTKNLQGVDCFDGPYVDCVVENNVVVPLHYHGITRNDASGCRILNNTAIDPSRQYPAWIRTASVRAESSDCVTHNNLSYSIPDEGGGVLDHNIQLTDPLSDRVFVDWRAGDSPRYNR